MRGGRSERERRGFGGVEEKRRRGGAWLGKGERETSGGADHVRVGAMPCLPLLFFLQEKRGACGGDDKGRRRRDRAGAGWVVGGLGQPTWLA